MIAAFNTYFVDSREYTTAEPSLAGMKIKANAGIPGNDWLFYEPPGQEPNRRVNDGEAFDLRGTPKRFFSTPPASMFRT